MKYELDGYETVYSEWMPVPPPQTDVNVGLVSIKAPAVESVEIVDGKIVVTFDQYIDPSTMNNVMITGNNDETITYSVDYSKDETALDGTVYAKVFALTVDDIDSVATIVVPSSILNYAGRNAQEYETMLSDTPVVKICDVNGDGEITTKDVTILRRYLAGGWDVTINEANSDINGDGEVTTKDVTLLRRHLAGGWGVELG